MSIPAIAPYELPGEAELPQGRVDWQPDPRRALLLIHDMQRYFLRAFTEGASPLPELLANIGRLRQRCAEQGIPVLYSAQPGGQTPAQRGLLQDFWGPGVPCGAEQEQIIEALAPGHGDLVLTKWRYSAFQRTDLLAILRRHGRDQLIISGVYAHIGCLLTAAEAFMSDVQPFLVADAVADFSPEHHHMALNYAAQRCARVLSTGQLLAALTPVPVDALDREQIRADVAELLEESPADLAEDDNLLDRGLDSIRLMSLVERWRAAGAEVGFVELAERPTLAAWWQLLEAPSLRR
ncbi:MAG: isochorismatase [Roseiflexaceae bacterium]